MRARHIKNSALEAAQFQRRAAIGFGAVVLALIGLALWYFKLQVVDHSDYATRSEANRIKQRPVVPGRGLIYDRKGRILADNIPAYRLDVVPDEAGDIKQLIASLSKIVALTPEDIARFEDARKVTRGFFPVTLRLRITDDEAARFAVDRWRYHGVELVPYLTRRYPHGDLFAHVIGYVGRIDKRDLEKLGDETSAFSHTGKTGIERYYDAALRGRIGYEQVETNVEGRAIGTVGRVPATPGADLRLSLDLDLQRAATIAFGELQGSAIAVDPRTGEILAMISLPTYDPNLFVNGISHADFRRLMDDPARPLFNRNVLGGVAPGSTMKPFIGLAGLDSGLRTPEDKVLSTGMFYLPGQRRGYGDSHRGGHGWTDLRKSISQSVNTYYYRLALDLGIARFDEYLGRYGFGAPTGIDLQGEIGGILPSPEWKAEHASRQGRWYPGDTVISGIGQGFWKVTSLQLAQATAALADDGRLRRPHLVRERRDGFGAPWRPLAQPPVRRISTDPMHLTAVREGMIDTVHGSGTATNIAQGLTYHIAGKTGTAQVVSRRGTAAMNPRMLPLHLRHRALFIGYAPAENPTIAVAVAVEGGGYGAATAAPIARKIFDAWLLGKMPDPDPDALPSANTGLFANVVSGTPVASSAAPTPVATASPTAASPAVTPQETLSQDPLSQDPLPQEPSTR